MKVGDLVKMKYAMFWKVKDNPRITYTEQLCLVLETSRYGSCDSVKLLFPDGEIKRDLVEYWETVSESR